MKQYDKSQNYDLLVINIYIDNDAQFYVVEDEDTRYKVRMFEFQKHITCPNKITCKVVDFEVDGSPIFEQDRYILLSGLYHIGQTYPFRVGTRYTSATHGNDFYFIHDKNGFLFKWPVKKQEYMHEGKTIECLVTDIVSTGTLRFKPKAGSVFLQSNFITYEQLFENLGLDTFEENTTFETLKKNRDTNVSIHKILTQYEQESGLWVISYLSLISTCKKRAINEENYALADKLNRLYSLIAEWVIEDSDFLTVYPPDKIELFRTKIEEELGITKLQLHASELIRMGKAEGYFERIIQKIRVSGYICSRENRVRSVLQLLHFQPTLLDKHPESFLFFIHYLTKERNKDEILSVQKVINRFITQRSAELNACINLDQIDPETINRTWILIRYIAASLLINEEKEDIRCMQSMMYRYLCMLEAPQHRWLFIDKSLNALFTVRGYRPEFNWENLLYGNSHTLISQIRSFINIEEITFSGEQIHTTNHGYLRVNDSRIDIYPREYAGSSPVEIVSLYKGRLCIRTSKKEKKSWQPTTDLGILRTQWDTLQSQFKYMPILPTYTPSENAMVGKSLLIQVQNINKNYPLMVFARIEDSELKGTGVLHVSNVAQYCINSLESVFAPGDRFRVTVVSAKEGKIQFSILEELDKISASQFEPGDQVIAKLVRISKNTLIWVNADGNIFYTEKTNEHPFELGMSAELLIDGILVNNQILATFIEESSAKIDELEALRRIVREYIEHPDEEEIPDDPQELEETNPDNEEEPKNQEDPASKTAGSDVPADFTFFNTEVIRELIYLHYLAIANSKDPLERYQYIGSARLWAHLAGYKSHMEFFQRYMDYEESLYHFLYDHTRSSAPLKFTMAEEEVKDNFPIMRQWIQITQMLNDWNHPENEDTLYTQINSGDPLIAALSRVILSNNILCHDFIHKDTQIPLKTEIARLLHMDIHTETPSGAEAEDTIQLVNLGMEDGEKEFKSSIVYVAGSGGTPNANLQVKNILKVIAGFLNARGGTLYLGVRDTGDVIGLSDDFSYMKCGADGYERLLRSRIVKAFGKDINGLIVCKFISYEKRVICEIQVPRYSKLVPLDGIIWQRQGNETRILEGVSLLLQEERRSQENENTLEMVQPQPKEEKPEGRKTSRSIPTSLLRPNLPDNDGDSDDAYIAYWSIWENGEYIITNEFPQHAGIACTIAIRESQQEDFLVLGYENGYMNKVSLKTLLSKKRKYAYKNGQTKGVRLMFVSVASNKDAVFIRTLKNDTEFYKLYPVSYLKIHTDLSHKGTPVYSFKFGTLLQWDIIPEEYTELLSRLQNTLLTYQGISAKSNGFDREMKFIEEHLLQ